MNFKGLFVFLIILLVGISIVSAADTSDISTDTTDGTVVSSSVSDDSNLDKNTYDKDVTVKSNLKKDSRTIVLNSTSFDDYVSDGKFNGNVTDGDTVDVQGLLDGTHFGLTVNKPVNIISSTNDAYIGADSPMGFTISSSGSGTNITGIHFHNVHFVVQHASNIFINNITVETAGQLVGSGRGVTSIREDSSNITVNNSYFKSENNLGVSTLVCAVAQDVLIENCTIEAIGFCGNLVYFTTYNVDYDHSRGYGNRNITFRNNHVIGLDAIQQSICYGLTMEGIGHTIENNVIEYGYYCIQQQANVDNNDEVSRITIINNTIPYGMNNIAYAQVENNTFNNIENLRYCNFTNNIANNVNITGTGTFTNNTVNSLNIKTNNNNITNNTIFNSIEVSGNNNIIDDNTTSLVVNSGDNNTLNVNSDAMVLGNVITITNSNYLDYGSRSNGVLKINRVNESTLVLIDGDSFYNYINRIVINTTADNLTFKITSQKVYNITINSTGITIMDTNMPFTSIYSNESVKLVNSIFLSTDTIDNLILDNSTILTLNTNLIVYDDDTYSQIFNSETGILLDYITDNTTIMLRNKSANGNDNKYNNTIVINKKVNILSFDNITYNANINFIEGSQNSIITNMTVNATITVESDNITIENTKINNIILKDSKNVEIINNKFNTDTTAITLENSKENNILNNSITTTSQYTIEMDETSTANNILYNYLKSSEEYNIYSVNADTTQNNIQDNKPMPYSTTITLTTPSNIILNTPTQVNISVSYYKDLVPTGYIVILANGKQKDNITLTGGLASANLTFTDDGINTIKVWYFGSDNYATSTTAKNITAKKITTQLNFTEITPTKVGENMTVTLEVKGDDGNINDGNITLTIRDDTFTADIHDGVASTNITVKENYLGGQITVYYPGTETRYNKTVTSTLNIQKGDSIIKIINQEVNGNSITLTAEVYDINGNPVTGGGRIRFEGTDFTRSSLLAVTNATASYTITPKPTNDFKVNVTFRNNNAFEQKTQEFTIFQTLTPKNVTITLTAENTKIGENLTLTATATDSEGTNLNVEPITFNIGNDTYQTTLINGMATYTIQTTEEDYDKTITAQTLPSIYYNRATSNTVQLEKGDVIMDITQEETDDKTVITAKVTDINNNPIKTGSIKFNQEEIVLVNSTAVYEVSSDITEDVVIDVTFTNNPAFNDNTQQITIEAKEIPLTLKIDTTEFVTGQASTIKASIYRANTVASDINSGKIVFKVNGKTLKDSNGKVIYAKVTGGIASIEYQIPENWNNTQIQAIYSGSAILGGLKSDKETITVTKAQPTITFTDITARKSDNIQIKVQLKQADNNINTGKIVIKLNGKTLKNADGKVIYAQVINGEAIINYTIPSNMKNKDYTLTATFISNDYERIESNQTLTITE